MVPVALTIAGSDPSGGAGVQADLRTFAALGVYGLCAVSALIAENSREVRLVEPVPEQGEDGRQDGEGVEKGAGDHHHTADPHAAQGGCRE